MDLIDSIAADMGKRPGDVSIKDLMDYGVDPVKAQKEVMDRAEKQRTGKAPSAPSTTPPGWSYTPQPTQPAIDLGKKVLPEIQVPTNEPPSRSSGGSKSTKPPSAAVPAAPQLPTVQPSLAPGQLNGVSPFVWLGIGFVALLLLTRR